MNRLFISKMLTAIQRTHRKNRLTRNLLFIRFIHFAKVSFFSFISGSNTFYLDWSNFISLAIWWDNGFFCHNFTHSLLNSLFMELSRIYETFRAYCNIRKLSSDDFRRLYKAFLFDEPLFLLILMIMYKFRKDWKFIFFNHCFLLIFIDWLLTIKLMWTS